MVVASLLAAARVYDTKQGCFELHDRYRRGGDTSYTIMLVFVL